MECGDLSWSADVYVDEKHNFEFDEWTPYLDADSIVSKGITLEVEDNLLLEVIEAQLEKHDYLSALHALIRNDLIQGYD